MTKALLPIAENAKLYDPKQVETYLKRLFQYVDWEAGQVISLLGIGEKGTSQEGRFKERKIIPPAFLGSAHEHLKRWAQWHVASFIVPAVLTGAAAKDEKATVDRVAALTALILDIDSGDTEAKRSHATASLGRPSMIIASGGSTETGAKKLHLYWLFNEASDEVERVAATRKLLAAKVGGDQSFGRATQVVRIPGTVHAKHGNASQCSIVDLYDGEYSFDDLADIVTEMQPMPGVEPPKPELPMLSGSMMDFSPAQDTAIDALHRDIHEGGEDLTRWSEFNKTAGFYIAEARAGRIQPQAAYEAVAGWMLAHMVPPWPQARFDQEFQALVRVDVARHGPFPWDAMQAVQTQPAAAATLEPTPAGFPMASSLPPRPWLLGRWLMRGKVTAMIAPGGVGKSTLTNAIALSLATGRELLGKTVYGGPLGAWLWNLEDDGDSLARQRVAAAIHYGIKSTDVEGRFYVDSGPDGAELCTAVEDRNGFTILAPVYENITAALIRNPNIACLIVDPFVSSHRVNENDNNKIDAVTKAWARVAVAANRAIVLVHHSRKLGGEAVTADSSRGAGALNNAARMTLVLNRMTPEQAEFFGMDPERHRAFFSVADDKHNLAPAAAADWFELVGVTLGNATDVHEADSVGVVVPWKPPRALDGVDLDHLFRIQKVLASGDYFRDARSKVWVGNVIANILKFDAGTAAGKKRVVELVGGWIKNGTLKVEMRANEQRKMKEAVTVGRWVIDPDSATALLKSEHLSEMETDMIGNDNGG